MLFFFFNDTATTEIYTLSLHDALPISQWFRCNEEIITRTTNFVVFMFVVTSIVFVTQNDINPQINTYLDRKSTRLNSSHANISYAVFCLKKKIIIILFICLYLL